MVKHLNTTNINFEQDFNDLLLQNRCVQNDVSGVVKDILQNVKNHGDQALFDYTKKFDKFLIDNYTIRVRKQEIEDALSNCNEDTLKAIKLSAKRITDFHIRHIPENDQITDDVGVGLGIRWNAVEAAGIYVPGGKAAYPSSVLMNAIPAKVAGVSELIMVVPMPNGEVNDLVLAAAAIAGVDRIFAIGGAQAVAALAYGTETIPPVDKIVGPGNIYVATAKGMVFGTVGIDMIAGPSEILVVCDGKTDPEWIAMDLFSQAEHDEDAQSILISQDAGFLDQVEVAIGRLLPTMERAEIIQKSLSDRAALILVKDLDEAIDVVNFIAPEHLELSVDEPMTMAKKVRHAGAIFMGRYTAEALGDYCAGPNHVLPTSRTARFSSPLGVYDFQKRSSLIQVSEQGAQTMGRLASVLARGEGLTAHARSAEYRLKDCR